MTLICEARNSVADQRLHQGEPLKLSAKNWPGLARMRWKSKQKTMKDGRCYWPSYTACTTQMSKVHECAKIAIDTL